MRWLRSVGSLKLQIAFAEYRLFYRALLHKRPIILRSLLIVDTPYVVIQSVYSYSKLQYNLFIRIVCCNTICLFTQCVAIQRVYSCSVLHYNLCILMICCNTICIFAQFVAIQSVYSHGLFQYNLYILIVCCNTICVFTWCVAIQPVYSHSVLQYNLYIHTVCCNTTCVFTQCVAIRSVYSHGLFQYNLYIRIVCCSTICVFKQSVYEHVISYLTCHMLVGSFKLQVSFAKEPYKRDDILQKIVSVSTCDITSHMSYGIATISRLLRITGLFFKRAL